MITDTTLPEIKLSDKNVQRDDQWLAEKLRGEFDELHSMKHLRPFATAFLMLCVVERCERLSLHYPSLKQTAIEMRGELP